MLLNKPILFYGLDDSNDIVAKNIEYSKEGIKFDLVINKENIKTFKLPIYGQHQLMDALAVISVCYYENIDSEIVNENLSFDGFIEVLK